MKKIIKMILLHMTTVSLLLTACGQATPSSPPTVSVDDLVLTFTAATPVPPTLPPTPVLVPNHDHLLKLAEGIKAWNAWRRDNKDIIPDLSGANQLKSKDLREINFSRTLLVEANLDGTILIDANLKLADLTNADLRNADLTGANLTDAKLAGARYNNATKWPAGFDPVAAGAVR